jgi:hypothetical protein
MVTRSRYTKTQQTNPYFAQITPSDFGHQCIYNHQLKLLFVSAPSDVLDSTNSNWISAGSGSVFVYDYDEVSTNISQIQKISQPNINVDGIASKRHASARFGQSIDTYGDWLIIGCPGDVYSVKFDGLDVVRSNQFVTTDGRTITTAATGSVYFYKWNGTTFDYVNKVIPPLYQDFNNPVNENDTYHTQTQHDDYVLKYGIYCGNGSAFGSSVSVDKSAGTSYTSSNIPTMKLVAVGAPNAVCSHSTLTTFNTGGVPAHWKGPFGGVWILSYDTVTLKWRLFSEKLTLYSFGGTISENNGTYVSFAIEDVLGLSCINSDQNFYSSMTLPFTIPKFAFDARAAGSKFGERVCIGSVFDYETQRNTHKLTVYDSYGFFMSDDSTNGVGGNKFTRGGNTYFFDLYYSPVNEEKYSLALASPRHSRRKYIAQESLRSKIYSNNVSGYSTFCDLSRNENYGVGTFFEISDQDKQITHVSAGFSTLKPVSGTTLASQNGIQAYTDSKLFKYGSVGSHDIKQSGRLCFVSATGMIRTSTLVAKLNNADPVSSYSNIHSADYLNGNKKIAARESCDCIIIFDIKDIESLDTHGWILAPPNSWSVQQNGFEWSGGFGRHFDVYQESELSWIVASSCLTDYEKQFKSTDSPQNDYIYKTTKAKVKTHLYRLTYDGHSFMSASLINTISGKIVNGGLNSYPSFDNLSAGSVVRDENNYDTYCTDMMRKIQVSDAYNFISPAIIKNSNDGVYYVAEGWAGDSDTSPSLRQGTLNLTVVESYEINPASFITFCE